MQSEYIWDCLSKAKSLPKIERLKCVFSIFFAGLGSLLLWRDLLKAREREREQQKEALQSGPSQYHISLSVQCPNHIRKTIYIQVFPLRKSWYLWYRGMFVFLVCHPLKRNLDRSWSYVATLPEKKHASCVFRSPGACNRSKLMRIFESKSTVGGFGSSHGLSGPTRS